MAYQFQSTPPVWAETAVKAALTTFVVISIHSARVGGDRKRNQFSCLLSISITTYFTEKSKRTRYKFSNCGYLFRYSLPLLVRTLRYFTVRFRFALNKIKKRTYVFWLSFAYVRFYILLFSFSGFRFFSRRQHAVQPLHDVVINFFVVVLIEDFMPVVRVEDHSWLIACKLQIVRHGQNTSAVEANRILRTGDKHNGQIVRHLLRPILAADLH